MLNLSTAPPTAGGIPPDLKTAHIGFVSRVFAFRSPILYLLFIIYADSRTFWNDYYRFILYGLNPFRIISLTISLASTDETHQRRLSIDKPLNPLALANSFQQQASTSTGSVPNGVNLSHVGSVGSGGIGLSSEGTSFGSFAANQGSTR